jgi:uncharacterized protein (TIGR02246 family)
MLVAAAALGSCTPAVPRGDPGARLQIEYAMSRYVTATNEGDADALTRLYTEDAVLLPPDHQPIQGREAIADFWRQGTDPGLEVTTIRLDVDGNLGYLVGSYHLPATEREPADSGKYVMCLQRQADGAWKLTADIWNSSVGGEDPEEPGRGPAASIT